MNYLIFAVITVFASAFLSSLISTVRQAWQAAAPIPLATAEGSIQTPTLDDEWDTPTIYTPALVIPKPIKATLLLAPAKPPTKSIAKMLKAELIKELTLWGLPTIGTVPQLRKALALKY